MVRQLGIVALLVSVVVGCGSAAGRTEGPRAADEAPVWTDGTCPAQDMFGSSGKRGGVPADFAATAVVRCRTEVREIPGEGTWTVRITERADEPDPTLVDLLRRPSDTPPPGQLACPAVGYAIPYVLLINAEGEALLPVVPTEVCGRPRGEVTDILDSLPYQTVTETRVALSRSQESADTGCYDLTKDTIAIGSPESAPATPVWPDGGADDVLVCLYTVTGDTGRLESGFAITGQEGSALKEALGAAGPAAPCDTPHTRFATLRAPLGSDAAVELDGCSRFLRPDNTLGQLDEDVIAMITG